MVDVIHVNAAHGQGFHIVPGADFFAADIGVAGLECPGDKGAETAGLILQAADFFHVFNTLFHGFTEADNHGGRAFHADGVGGLHDGQPVVSHDFLGADDLAHAVGEDFGTAAGQAVKAGRLQAFEGFEDGQSCLPGKVLDFRGREGMDSDIKVRFYFPQHFLVKRQA